MQSEEEGCVARLWASQESAASLKNGTPPPEPSCLEPALLRAGGSEGRRGTAHGYITIEVQGSFPSFAVAPSIAKHRKGLPVYPPVPSLLGAENHLANQWRWP
ncbi:hypothetical protein B0T17DRAFT_319921 [Bombardia bombarda]|uniref:Uncharacterized protein n=1 Tax=Bombardia bombarda TaxID=252184 RepID=A0AA39WMC3_9PEZI|nr:hypothetical protein B0T17DRAFT_319921 [Bombardia bombarda]